MPKSKAAEPLFDQLSKTLETDGEELVSKLKVHTYVKSGFQPRLPCSVNQLTINRLIKENFWSGSCTVQD